MSDSEWDKFVDGVEVYGGGAPDDEDGTHRNSGDEWEMELEEPDPPTPPPPRPPPPPERYNPDRNPMAVDDNGNTWQFLRDYDTEDSDFARKHLPDNTTLHKAGITQHNPVPWFDGEDDYDRDGPDFITSTYGDELVFTAWVKRELAPQSSRYYWKVTRVETLSLDNNVMINRVRRFNTGEDNPFDVSESNRLADFPTVLSKTWERWEEAWRASHIAIPSQLIYV